MKHKPQSVTILAARIMRAYPSLSPYSAASLATELCAIERAQRRHAERCCSGEDGGYVTHKRNDKGEALHRCHYCEAQAKVRGDIPYVEHAAYCPVARVTLDGRYVMQHDPAAEERAGKRIVTNCVRWENSVVALHDRGPLNLIAGTSAVPVIELQGDPRGPVLLVRFPGETEASAV